MKSNILINVDNLEYINDYEKAGITAFLFSLEDYSVGYNTYSIEQINKINVSNKYIMINRILDCKSIDELEIILPKLKGIKGIVYEDIGVYKIVKKLNLNIELIYYQNHFGTNIESINFWTQKVDSMFVSNEITKEEILNILEKSNKKLVLHLYGYNQVMYSRRLLLTNWSEEFNIPYKNQNIIEDTATHVKFRAIENKYGTVMYSEKIFNGSELFNNDKVKFYYINPTMIEHNIIMDFLNNIKTHKNEQEDTGFLYKETIYKLKGAK